MTANDFLTISIDRYGFMIDTEPLYISLSWGGIVLVGLVIVSLKTLRRYKNKK